MPPKSNSPLSDWLDYLSGVHSSEIDLGLERIRIVAERGNLLGFNCPVVTIAGTNGKGSTAATLQYLAIETDKNVGVYTSPHLIKFNERIQVNGFPVSDQCIIDAFVVVERLRGDTSLTYFEFTTLAAFYIFQQEPLDLVVLEVGLGGRLDAVNIVDPTLAIITSISKDHESWLGHTIVEIAREKAGILRESIPFVAATPNMPSVVLDIAKDKHCRVYQAGADFTLQITSDNTTYNSARWRTSVPETPQVHPLSLGAGIFAYDYLFPRSVTERLIVNALRHVSLYGRSMTIQRENYYFVDVAHNPDSAKYLASWLEKSIANDKPLRALIGIMADKDIKGTLAHLADLVDYWHPIPLAIQRAATPASISQVLKTITDNPIVPLDSIEHYERLYSGEQTLIFGSFYTVEAALNYFQHHG